MHLVDRINEFCKMANSEGELDILLTKALMQHDKAAFLIFQDLLLENNPILGEELKVLTHYDKNAFIQKSMPYNFLIKNFPDVFTKIIFPSNAINGLIQSLMEIVGVGTWQYKYDSSGSTIYFIKPQLKKFHKELQDLLTLSKNKEYLQFESEEDINNLHNVLKHISSYI